MPEPTPAQTTVKRGINKENAKAMSVAAHAAKLAIKLARDQVNGSLGNSAIKTVSAVKQGEPTTIQRAIEARSDKCKAYLSMQAEKQTSAIALRAGVEPVTFKTVVEACDKLFGWSRTTQPSCLIQNNYLHEIAPDRVPQPVVSCGVSPDTEQNNQKL